MPQKRAKGLKAIKGMGTAGRALRWWGKGTNWRRQEECSKPSREGPRGARVAAGSRAGGGAAWVTGWGARTGEG